MVPTHYLRRNKSAALPGQCLTIHCQPLRLAEPPEHSYYANVCGAWAAVYWRNRDGKQSDRGACCGDRADTFWEFVHLCMSPQRPLWIFGYHMGTTLKMLGYWNLLDTGIFSNRSTYRSESGAHRDNTTKQHNCITCTDDPPTILRHWRTSDESTIVIVDCANYWPATIMDLAASTSIEIPTNPQIDSDSDTYRRTSIKFAEIIESALYKYMLWIRKKELGMFRYTIAGQSMAAFRHKYLKTDILIHQNEHARKIERAGYYGGQTECYWLGPARGPLYKVDVNAMYPSVMIHNKFPTKLIECRYGKKTPATIPPLIPLCSSIAIVTIAAEQRSYPYRSENRTTYPIGTYQTTLAGPELVDAYNRGEVLKWHAWTCYTTAELFTEFVESLWSQRLKQNAAGYDWLASCTKWLMNSLYGKFGQKNPKWTELIGKRGWPKWGRQFIYNARTRDVTTVRHIAGQVYRLNGFEEHPEAVPSIAAFITSYAREKMRGIREIAGQENVLYQCCDSLLVDQTGMDRLSAAGLINETELGKLKIVGEYKEVDVLGVNYIRLDSQWISAGISQKIIEKNGNYWTTEIEQRMDSYLDQAPDDVHVVRFRTHVKSPYTVNGKPHAEGIVRPQVIHTPVGT